MNSLSNKNIVIAGASSGIGEATAKLCHQAGANVIGLGRNEERLKALGAVLGDERFQYFAGDLINEEEVEQHIAEAVAKSGPIEGLVYSAGIEMTLPLKVLKTANFEQAFQINTVAAFQLAKIISKKKYMHPEKGSFIFIASVMSVDGQPAKIAYCATKGALVAGSRAMALELAPRKIRVNCISPGLVITPMSNALLESLPEASKIDIEQMHPLGIGKPEDVGNACVYLLSEEAQWVTGINLMVDGGYSAK